MLCLVWTLIIASQRGCIVNIEQRPGLLIFTDLDGTLIDHYSYSADAALSTLAELQAQQIPVIFNTSKTIEECQSLASELNLDCPFIVENGSAICFPDQAFAEQARQVMGSATWQSIEALDGDQPLSVCVLGADLASIHEQLMPLQSSFDFLVLSMTDVDTVCELTGLNTEQARKAQQRRYSEPLIWRDSEPALAGFKMQVAALGLTLLQGGRFIHVLGPSDKGRALQALSACYRDICQKPFETVALGDSGNDLAMLQAADHPVLIRSPAHTLPTHNNIKNLRISQSTGPAGWAECISELIQPGNKQRG